MLDSRQSLHLWKRHFCSSTVWRQQTDWREQITTRRDLSWLLYSHNDIAFVHKILNRRYFRECYPTSDKLKVEEYHANNSSESHSVLGDIGVMVIWISVFRKWLIFLELRLYVTWDLLIKKFPVVYVTRRSVTVFTNARHRSYPEPEKIHAEFIII